MDIEIEQRILALGHLGWSLRHIEQASGVRREAVSEGGRVGIRGRGRPTVRGPKPAISVPVSIDFGRSRAATGGDLSTGPATGAASSRGRTPSANVSEPCRGLIIAACARVHNAISIWQDLVETHGFVALLRAATPPEARVVVQTAPRDGTHLRYGEGPMARETPGGRYRRTRLFVFVLSYSRKAMRLLVWRSIAQTRAGPHERTFRRLGVTGRVVVFDNLREGVLAPDIRDSDRKGNVEAVFAHALIHP